MTAPTLTDLKNIVIPSDTVEIGKQSFRVTGLPLHKLLTLFEHHIEYLDKIIEGDSSILATLLQETPELVARLIAESAEFPEDWEHVTNFPSQVQLQALSKIINLTFPDQELLGKWSRRLEEVLERALVKAVRVTERLQSPSSTPSNSSTVEDTPDPSATP